MAEYGKSYSTKEEYERRKEAFAQMIRFVSEKNSQNGANYRVGLN
jgi:Cathepsin propeptide inhibitor domain (I29)